MVERPVEGMRRKVQAKTKAEGKVKATAGVCVQYFGKSLTQAGLCLTDGTQNSLCSKNRKILNTSGVGVIK